MPVYVCRPGHDDEQPWNYGIQAFAQPFDVDERVTEGPQGRMDLAVAVTPNKPSERTDNHQDDKNVDAPMPVQYFQPRSFVTLGGARTNNNTNHGTSFPRFSSTQHPPASPQPNAPVRRVRHAEVVIVDDVCVVFGRYWLRLRWPGSKGGFAGYIAMEQVNLNNNNENQSGGEAPIVDTTKSSDLDAIVEDTREDEDLAREDTGSMPSAEPFDESEAIRTMICRRTGLPFQSTSELKLLVNYDDGVISKTALPPFPTEPVFCRICREGLHEDADDELPAAANDEGISREPSRNEGDNSGPFEDDGDFFGEPRASEPPSETSNNNKGPALPIPSYKPNNEALHNPMLAPCECSGSMAFVHFLCLEQWRCRSRHPEAANGLNCETCNTPYSLPPPMERRVQVPEQEDWLEAMPPHVMDALRRPHIWWQLGANVVRRRWLRPLAPVLMSPIVALYCRARRLLKKRGVARRRWACSLCRRRARWKCVRCLRSYYCSRQCQNVSWHIVHKHLCYKPVRLYWSVILYSALTLALFPGILRDPLMYDIGIVLVPVSFIMMGIIGGGLATLLKKTAGLDLRGRRLELAVVIATIWFSAMSWGLVKAFFGESNACYGFPGAYSVSMEELSSTHLLRGLYYFLLRPAQASYSWIDRRVWLLDTFLRSQWQPWSRLSFCPKYTEESCFEHLPNANAGFFLSDNGGDKCAADTLLFVALYVAAGVSFAMSTLWKNHERQRRRVGVRRRGQHLHQD